MSKVVIKKCEQYNLELVKNKIRESVDLLGGFKSFIKPNDRVFIKLNCLGPYLPNQGITTHPIFTKAVIQLVKEITQDIIIGDNPATKDIIYVLKKNGNYDIIKEENISIFNGKELTLIHNENSHLHKDFQVSKDMIDVDVLINLPKLKTHSLAYMTVAQKNLFGFIYGLTKASWHFRANNPLEFGEALNDLYGAILDSFKNKKILHICDGIIGLEGEGPGSGGITKNANVILTSFDGVSLDRVAVDLVKLDYNKLFINKIANERNLGNGNINKIEIIGDSLSNFKDLQFQEPVNPLSSLGLKLLRHKSLRNLILEHPIIDTSICIKCGECAKICPPKTMQIKPGRYPKLTTKNCIRCWCCSEICPQNAIKKSKRPLLGKFIIKD